MEFIIVYGGIIFLLGAAALQILALLHKAYVKVGGRPLLKVESPCFRHWKELPGGKKARFCDLCKKNVINVCKISKVERKELLKQIDNGEDICIYIEPSLIRRFAYTVGVVFITVVGFVGYKKLGYNDNDSYGPIMGSVLSDDKFENFGSPNDNSSKPN